MSKNKRKRERLYDLTVVAIIVASWNAMRKNINTILMGKATSFLLKNSPIKIKT
jgi:hypothetical protein